MKNSLKALVVFCFLLFACFFVAAFFAPSLFDFIESRTNSPLPYEGALRLFFIGVWMLLLLCALYWVIRRGDRRHWLMYFLLCGALIPLVIVFFLDTSHRLLEEYSWIRYITAGSLVLASLVSFLLAGFYIKEGRSKHTLAILWFFFCAAYGFGAFDELFEAHEAIGRFLRERVSLGAAVTDYVTLGYALAGLIVIALSFRIFMREYRGKSPLFSTTLFLGISIYLVSTLLDTFDVIFEKKLRSFAKLVSADNRHIFSDLWYVLWAPHNFLNGLEEVFEFLAATLFFIAGLILFLEKRFLAFAQREKRENTSHIRATRVVGMLILFTAATSLLLAVRHIAASTPLTDSRISIQRIAGPQDSLRHTDDLFWHPLWGLIIGNEGRGTVLQLKAADLTILEDAKKQVSDTDSVTASKQAIYASDGAKGIIFSYTKERGWEKAWSREQGLYHPEALVAKNGMLYVLDESKRSITKLTPGKPAVIWKPRHKEWKTPEGIAYDPTTDTLIVTDDTTGAVFRIVFEKSIEKIASLKNPEDVTVLGDGRIVLTDTAWGAVFMLEKGKNPRMLFQFKRPYRDLQGIAVDNEKRIYVVTADGFDSVSFMPSFLFRIERVL